MKQQRRTYESTAEGPSVVAPVRIRPGVQCRCPMPDCIALVACRAGSLQIDLRNGGVVRLSAGDACLMPAHSEYCVNAPEEAEGVEVVLSVAHLMERHGPVIAYSPVLHALVAANCVADPLLFSRFYDEGLAHVIESMMFECDHRDVLYRESFECGVRHLTIALARNAERAVPAGSAPLTAEAIVAYLEKHLEDATLASVARHFAYHPNTVAALLRRERGCTFGELVTSLRMERAESLVAHSTIPVQRIAAACGYRNMTHFYDLFRRLFACTPGEYRAQAVPVL